MPHLRPQGVVSAAAEYLYLPRAEHIHFGLAVAVSASADGDPCWGMLVGAPSSGKSEAIRLFDGLADERVADVTAPGLLSLTAGKRPRPTGLLTRLGARAFVLISDMSPLLATSDRGGRDEVFALLRGAFDGHVSRHLGRAEQPLEWAGRLTFLAGATPAIDRFSSHTNALGPRWAYLRMPELDSAGRRQQARSARERAATAREARKHAQDVATAVVRAAVKRLPDIVLTEEVAEELDELAIVTSMGRASIDREQGARTGGIAVVEFPSRIVGQLAHVARGMLALGASPAEALSLARQVALDSMPLDRRRVLDVLADGELLSRAEIERRSRLHRATVARVTDELLIAGVLTAQGRDEKWAHKLWGFAPEEEAALAAAFRPSRNVANRGTRDSQSQVKADSSHTSSRSSSGRAARIDNGVRQAMGLIDDALGEGQVVLRDVIGEVVPRLGGPGKRSRDALVRRAVRIGLQEGRYVGYGEGDEMRLLRQGELPVGDR